MKSFSVRSLALSLALLAFATLSANAQTRDRSKIEIKTNKITSNFYTLDGDGGTIGLLTGPDGVFMVDAQYAELSQKIVAAVKAVSPTPIRFLVNTHVHGDHTGGNENFGKMGITLLSRDELRERLAHPSPAANGTVPPSAPDAALPLITYSGRVTFHMDGEEINLIPIPHAHTDGDTMIYFRNNDIIMIGDFFRSVGYPNIDRVNGGSLAGMIDGLGVAIGICDPNTKVIPGHGPAVDRVGLTAHRDMIVGVRDKVAAMIKQGMTVEQVVAAHPTADYDGKVDDPGKTGDRFVGQVYAELKSAK
jgi:cyclase